MQTAQQLSPFPAAEGVGQSAMGEVPSGSQGQEGSSGGLSRLPLRLSSNEKSSSSSHNPSKVEKRPKKNVTSLNGPYLHPLPTIETLMTFPSLSRPVYDRLVRGEPPAQTYKTVIHTPKPANMRTLDQDSISAADFSNYRRRKRANSGQRSRSSTGSSTSSNLSTYSTSSYFSADSESSASDISDPPSPASFSTAKATISSSPCSSPQLAPYQQLPPRPILTPTETTATPSIENDILHLTPNLSPSPAQSTLSWLTESSSDHSDSHTPSTSRSSAPSPASSAYPSPPSSPISSRRSSSSGEEYMAYPSPPPSPGAPALTTRPISHHRERRAFSFPSPPPAQLLAPPPLRRRSASLNSHPYSSSAPLDFGQEFDLGERELGGGSLDNADEDEHMQWSLNGGFLTNDAEGGVRVVEHEEDVFLGAAGLALSPRVLRGRCAHCEGLGGGVGDGGVGLGLYVIDEERESEGEL